MSEAVMFISFNLVKGASVPDFLLAAEKLNNEFISKQKGYISWKQLVSGEMWADLLTWATMEDAKNFLEPSDKGDNALAEKFYAFIEMDSCEMQLFSVEKSY